MQNIFQLATSPWVTPRFDETIAPCERLIEAFGDRVTFTRFVAPDRPEGRWRAYYETWPSALLPADDPMWHLVEPIARHKAPTVDAPTMSKWGPALAHNIGDAGKLVLCGVATECCVLATALAAADDGIEVVVVEDACAGASKVVHAQAIEIMNRFAPLITITTVDEILAHSP